MPSPITPAELLKLGDFAAGSMGPKVGAPAIACDARQDHASGSSYECHHAANASQAQERLRLIWAGTGRKAVGSW